MPLDPAEPGFNVRQCRGHAALLLSSGPPVIDLGGLLFDLGEDDSRLFVVWRLTPRAPARPRRWSVTVCSTPSCRLSTAEGLTSWSSFASHPNAALGSA
jgi:hypothetical protein